MAHHFDHPALRSPLEIADPNSFSTTRVVQNGQPVPKTDVLGLRYVVEGAHGPLKILVDYEYMRDVIRIRGEGIDEVIGEPLPRWLGAATLLPYGVMLHRAGVSVIPTALFVAAIGTTGWQLNRRIARRAELPIAVRTAAIVFLSALALASWSIIGGALRHAAGH